LPPTVSGSRAGKSREKKHEKKKRKSLKNQPTIIIRETVEKSPWFGGGGPCQSPTEESKLQKTGRRKKKEDP